MIVFKPKHETISAENLDGSFGQTINPCYTPKIRVKKMPKIDTLDALEEHEEHEDNYQTNSKPDDTPMTL